MRREVIPLEGEILHGDPVVLEAGLADVQRKVRQMGLWAPNLPVECGGLGLSMVDHGLFSEALGRSPLGHHRFGAQAPDAGNVEILHRSGTARAAGALAAPARGRGDPELLLDDRAGDAGLEPDDAGDAPRVRDGDDYVINGQKWFTSSADGAAFAIVMAVTNPDAPPHRGPA